MHTATVSGIATDAAERFLVMALDDKTKDVLDWELARVADERSDLTPKVGAFRRQVLAIWGTVSK